jgi:peptide subunit release factor 1 (eRF1)
MTATAIGPETLRELSDLATDGHPLLSVYLDLGGGEFPTPGARAAEASALLAHAGAHDADAERVRDLLRTESELLRESHGVAIFSCAATDVLEVVPLPSRVEPMAVVDTVPWLEPLAAMITSENWGVAVVSRRHARLFRGGAHGLVKFATIDDDVHRRHAQGGWAQARYQRGIEDQVAHHADHVAQLLARAHRRRAFDHLVVVAADELWPVVEAKLHPDLLDGLAGHVALDLESAPASEIQRAVTPLVEQAEQAREQALIARLEEALGTGGRAAAGVDEVLTLLEQERVEALLVLHGAQLTAGLCPRCGRLSADTENPCPLDGSPLATVDAVERAVELGAHQGADVVVIRHERAALAAHGSIGALLRW